VGLDRAVARLDDDRLIAGVKLDSHGIVRRLAVGEHQLKRPREPLALHGIAGLLLGHQRNPPPDQVSEHRPELLAARCEAK